MRAFAKTFAERFGRLDLLVNNAGVMMTPHRVTEEGLEGQLATNYLGHFALIGLLLPRLRETAGVRVVSLSSLSYKWSPIRFDDPHFSALIRPLGTFFLQAPERGAKPVVYAALEPGLRGGEYVGPDGFREIRGEPTVVDSSEETRRPSVGERVWAASEEETGVEYL